MMADEQTLLEHLSLLWRYAGYAEFETQYSGNGPITKRMLRGYSTALSAREIDKALLSLCSKGVLRIQHGTSRDELEIYRALPSDY